MEFGIDVCSGWIDSSIHFDISTRDMMKAELKGKMEQQHSS